MGRYSVFVVVESKGDRRIGGGALSRGKWILVAVEVSPISLLNPTFTDPRTAVLVTSTLIRDYTINHARSFIYTQLSTKVLELSIFCRLATTKNSNNPTINTTLPSPSSPHLNTTLNTNSVPLSDNSDPDILPAATLCVSLQQRDERPTHHMAHIAQGQGSRSGMFARGEFVERN